MITTLAVVRASVIWWYLFSGVNIDNRQAAALSAGSGVREEPCYVEVSELVAPADGVTMAFRRGGKKHLVDLMESTTVPARDDECFKVSPWAGGSMLCI